MKRVIISDASLKTATYLAKLEKFVRSMIYQVWNYDGNESGLFTDPNSLANRTLDYYVDEVDKSIKFSEYVYRNRHDLFDEGVKKYIHDKAKSEDDEKFMLDYYDSLSQSDYNRNLYLRRDDEELKRPGGSLYLRRTRGEDFSI